MDREATLLTQLAERPDDRALRLVFSDWLQEQGDERGEAIALWARGSLSLTERRRVARITALHAAEWLGPLAPLADLHRSRFVGGFLDELVCAPGRPPELYASLAHDPRLATVRTLAVPPTQSPAMLGAFLASPLLRRVQRLELGSTDWQELRGLFLPTPLGTVLSPPQVVVASWGAFQHELSPLGTVRLFQQGKALGLSTTEFINPLVVDEVHEAVMTQQRALEVFEEVMLIARYGVLEGAASWLLACDLGLKGREPFFSGAMFPRLLRWGVESGEVTFVRSREPGGRFNHLTIDLSAPESTGEKRASSMKPTAEVRIATAASVLVLLGPARLTSVDVKLAEGARLRSHERHTLFAASRRSGSLEHFSIIGEAAVLP